ncbi:MAG TPA: hypothetical protein PK230_07610, partial [Chitinophagales bacterium]|nr:hypothetical protein [Chitinophagales bacterium]
ELLTLREQFDVPPSSANSDSSLKVPWASLTIMVVDTQPPIRKLVSLTMKRSGFKVLEAADNGRKLYRIITPKDPEHRGCQLSLLTDHRGKALFDHLQRKGIMADWREPNVIRFAPVPLYNSFEDVYFLGLGFGGMV